jgi:hypothetical protein
MPLVEFEPTIAVLERGKTVHSLDHEATVIGNDASTFTYFYSVVK